RIVRTSVFVLEALEILRLVGALVLGVEVAVAVAITRLRRRRFDELALGAILRRRKEIGCRGVRPGEPDVPFRFRGVALLELDPGELEVALRGGELSRRAADGAVSFRLFRDLFETGDLTAELRRFCAAVGQSERQRREKEPSERAPDHRPAPRCASRESRMALFANSSAASARLIASL